MKKLVLICLLAGCGHCFSQNVGLKELLRVMEAPSVEWVNQYLSPLGYTGGNEEVALKGAGVAIAQVWGFRSDKTPDAPMIAELYRITDSAGAKLVYETSNPFFYTNIVNQLPGNNFQFKQATTVDEHVTLLFNNTTYFLLLEFVSDTHLDKPYTITLRPINKFDNKGVFGTSRIKTSGDH